MSDEGRPLFLLDPLTFPLDVDYVVPHFLCFHARTRDILKAFDAAVTAIRPPARNQKNTASLEKEIPGTEMTTVASDSFV
jgi:hypothetical protein